MIIKRSKPSQTPRANAMATKVHVSALRIKHHAGISQHNYSATKQQKRRPQAP